MTKKNRDEEQDNRVIPVRDGAAEPADEAAAAPDAAGETAALRAERDELLGRLQRVSADYANYQKRVRRDIEEAQHYGAAGLIRAIIGVLDDLERAIEHAKANHPADDPLLVGTQLVYDKAQDVLRRFGVETVDASGEFDPAVHEALMQQPTVEAPPMTVLSEVQKGYTLKGRTIRPAKVIVATAPPEDADEDDRPDAPADRQEE